eukprot:TRINITY_DN6989_c1_g1_i1.p1 TRINITY_DN6989_c1_g1~~TRINITY_DN6989_c1_g1_i1.p1  ORF type:complete len:529 (+),score=117.48 TRINITY_DN6989_c1_g1_i1:73-1659(+)
MARPFGWEQRRRAPAPPPKRQRRPSEDKKVITVDDLNALLSTRPEPCPCVGVCKCRGPASLAQRLTNFGDAFTVVSSEGDEGVLGQGSFGVVWRCCRKETRVDEPMFLAVKEIQKKSLCAQSRSLGHVTAEMIALTRLSHQNIVQLYEILHDDDSVFMVMECCETRDLYSYLRQCWNVEGRAPDLDTAASIMKQIFCALQYMHERMFVHRDVKSENCLYVSETRTVKLIDFGMAKYCSDRPISESPAGGFSPIVSCTPGQGTISHLPYESIAKYLDHEYIQTTRRNLSKMDVYGAGCIAYITLIGRLPYRVDEENERSKQERLESLRERMKGGPRIPTSGQHLSLPIQRLLLSTLQTDPDRRMSAADALRNEWVRSADGVHEVERASHDVVMQQPRAPRRKRSPRVSADCLDGASAEALDRMDKADDSAADKAAATDLPPPSGSSAAAELTAMQAAAAARAAAAGAAVQLVSLAAEQQLEREAAEIREMHVDDPSGPADAAEWSCNAAYDAIRLAEDDDQVQKSDLSL